MLVQEGAGPSFGTDWILSGAVFALVVVGVLLMLARGQSFSEFRLGLAVGVRGLVGKELRSRSRGWRPAVLLTAYLLVLSAGVAGFPALIERAGGVVSVAVGPQLFATLATVSVLLLAFITPALTVGAISGERERRTLDLLLVTRASALGLVSGKLLGSLFYVFFLMVASLPAFAMVYLFGGVPPFYLGMVLAVAAVTAVSYAALGLLLSALLRRTIVASVIAYLLVLALVFGLPFLAAVMSVAAQVQRSGQMVASPPPAYICASPLTSLSSVLPSGGGGDVQLASVMRMVLTGGGYGTVSAQSSYASISTAVYITGAKPVTGEVETVTTWAPWVYHFLLSAAATLLCVLATALLVSPLKPWKTK